MGLWDDYYDERASELDVPAAEMGWSGAPPDNRIICEKCGSHDWKAIEQFTSLTPCELIREDGEIQIEFDMRAEHVRDATTSTVVAYICANEECGNTIQAADLR